MRDIYYAETKKPEEMKGPSDLIKLVQKVPGSKPSPRGRKRVQAPQELKALRPARAAALFSTVELGELFLLDLAGGGHRQGLDDPDFRNLVDRESFGGRMLRAPLRSSPLFAPAGR